MIPPQSGHTAFTNRIYDSINVNCDLAFVDTMIAFYEPHGFLLTRISAHWLMSKRVFVELWFKRAIELDENRQPMGVYPAKHSLVGEWHYDPHNGDTRQYAVYGEMIVWNDLPPYCMFGWGSTQPRLFLNG